MKFSINSILDSFSKQPFKIFLIDGLGAVVSAFLLGVVLMNYQVHVGMPKEYLIYLAIAPCLFAVYSFFCYLSRPKKWRPLLKIIAFLNLFYCSITFSLLVILSEELTNLGSLYFIGEIIIVVSLAIIELKIANKHI